MWFWVLLVSLAAQPVAPNRVLDLDGTGDWVELPPAGFTNFHQATVEAWVKIRKFGALSARVFDFGDRQREMYVSPVANTVNGTLGVKFLLVDEVGGRRREDVSGGFQTNRWTHLAVVTGPGGVRIYLNGTLVVTNAMTGSLSSVGGVSYFLGRHNYRNAPESTWDGQMDEVRLWSVQRSEAEIQGNLFRRLSGREAGLAGLWNFDDATRPGRDATTNRFDGRLVGDAHGVDAEWPTVAEATPPALVEGRAADPDGHPISGAGVGITSREFFNDRGPTDAVPPPAWSSFGIADADGRFRLAVYSPPAAVALGGFARAGDLFGVRADLVLVAGQRLEADLELRGTAVIGGSLLALDNTPLVGMQIGLAAVRSAADEVPRFTGAMTTVRENGEFQFLGNRPPGRYELLAMTQRGPVALLDGQAVEFDPAKPLTNLVLRLAPMKRGRWRSFGVSDGLPSNQILSLFPEKDGTLWVGTGDGAARFDGRGFVPWELPASERDSSVYSFARSPVGELWACARVGLVRFDGNRWALRHGRRDGINVAIAVDWDSAGRMWVGTSAGLFRRDGDRFQQVMRPDGRSFGEVDSLLAETNGAVWIASWQQGVFRWDGREVRPVAAAPGLEVNRALKLYRDDEGQIWITAGERVLRWDAAARQLADAQVGAAGWAIHRDAQGVLWTGAGGPLLRQKPGGAPVVLRQQDGLVDDSVRALAPAPGNSLWVGTAAGLSHFDEEALQVLSTKDGLPGNVVTRVVLAPDGSVWFTCPVNGAVTGAGDTLCRYDGERITRFGREQGLGAIIIGSLVVGDDGVVWVGAGGNNGRGSWQNMVLSGLWRLDGHRFSPVDPALGLSNFRYGAMARGPGGSIWFGTENAVRVYDGKTVQSVPSPDQVYSLHRAPNNDVWIGTTSGAYRWNQHVLSAWTPTNGLPHRVMAVAAASNGVTWFGTLRGLFRAAQPHLPPELVVQRGVLAGSVWSLLYDRDGLLWVGTDTGVVRFDGEAWSKLDARDGLPGRVAYSIQQGADGALWMGTDGGLVRYRRAHSVPAAPAVTLRSDQSVKELASGLSVVQGRWSTLRVEARDTLTAAARRQYRVEIKAEP